MKPETKMGLIAVAAVVGVFVLVGGGIAVLVSGGATKTTAGKEAGKTSTAEKNRLAGPVSTGSKDDPVAYICGHRWWKKPPTKKQLDELVAQLISMNQGDLTFVTRLGVSERPKIPAYAVRQYPTLIYENLVIDASWTKRPTAEIVLNEIISELDQKEYRYGPGR